MDQTGQVGVGSGLELSEVNGVKMKDGNGKVEFIMTKWTEKLRRKLTSVVVKRVHFEGPKYLVKEADFQSGQENGMCV